MNSVARLQPRTNHESLAGRTLGDFLLGEEIDHGGCGTIYLARQRSLERDVVVKVLRADKRNDRILKARFLREAKLASMLEHPYAAHIYAFGVDDEQDQLMWIAMELVHGVTLEQWLEVNGPMSLEQLVPLIERIADVVHAAHRQGIVHRDLKPRNVMVIEWNGELIPKLLDFGIAKAPSDIVPKSRRIEQRRPESIDGMATHDGGRITAVRVQDQQDHHARLTQPGLGSWAYMSPEQWDCASEVGPPTDIYALGITIFGCLAGHNPFIGSSARDYEHQHRFKEPPPLTAELATLNPIVGRALAKPPHARHATALELAAELRAALRTSTREQLRFAAQQWQESQRSPDFLWDRERLRTRRNEPLLRELSTLECSFIAASQGRARRITWLRRILSIVIVVVLCLQARAMMRTRILEASAARAELEQGRAALLHGEPDAVEHLRAAYVYEPTGSTAFMLARALEPRMAERLRIKSSFGRMWSAAFSPDGQQLVTTDDLNAQVRDAQTGRLLFTLVHGDIVYRAVYAATGRLIATGCGDGAVRLWDASSGTLLRELRQEPSATPTRYYRVALSSDGKLVAGLGMGRGVVHVWETRSGRLVAKMVETDEGSNFAALEFSGDARWLAMTTGADIHIWDTQTWQEGYRLPVAAARSLSWDPDSDRLATGGAKGDVSIWDVSTGARLVRLRESGASIAAVSFASNSRFVAAGDHDGIALVWDAQSAALVSQTNCQNKILDINFDATASLLVVGSANGAVTVSDIASGMPATKFENAKAAMMTVRFAPKSQEVVGASWDGTARVWSTTAPHRTWLAARTADHCGAAINMEPDRRYVVTACDGEPIKIWDTARSKLVAELPSASPAGNGHSSAYPAVSRAGDRVALAHGSTIDVYELPTKRLRHEINHAAEVTALAFGDTGDVVSGAADGSILISRDDGTHVVLPPSTATIDVVSFLPRGWTAAADANQCVRIFDEFGVLRGSLASRTRLHRLRVSRDGRRLVTASSFGQRPAAPQLWDLEHLEPIADLAADGQGQVYNTRFADDDRIFTTCSDGAVRAWSSTDGRLLMTYRGAQRFLADALLSSDRAMVFAGGGGGHLYVWDASSGRQLWTMPAHKSDLFGLHLEGDDIVSRGYSGELARWRLPTLQQVLEACQAAQRCVELR